MTTHATDLERKKHYKAHNRKRQKAENRFRRIGLTAVLIGFAFVLMLFFTIIKNGYQAFWATTITLDITLNQEDFSDAGQITEESINRADYLGIIKKTLLDKFPEAKTRKDKKALYGLVSSQASFDLQRYVESNPNTIGQTITLTVPADDDIDMYNKGYFKASDTSNSRISEQVGQWAETFRNEGKLQKQFNALFFTNGDSREPELAGIRGAITGSLFVILITFLLSFPIGVAAACYLEEFAPKNKWTDIIEVNINNLAAVPSIVFGLLGLAVFINFFGLPRSTPIIGALVLTLMTLPTIIISSRAALKSVPPSIRDAGFGMGASRLQTLMHHTLPLAMPGMLTGSIIGMAQALGETAPLLMIGMIAFIVDVPNTPFDPSTVMPVQIYLWADSPERAFTEKTSAAIMVLLFFLIFMNAVAVLLRKKFERKWS